MTANATLALSSATGALPRYEVTGASGQSDGLDPLWMAPSPLTTSLWLAGEAGLIVAMDKTSLRNRRASAAYRRRLREAAAPTSRDLANVLLDSFVRGLQRGRPAPVDKLVAQLVKRGFDAEQSARLLEGLVARRAEAA